MTRFAVGLEYDGSGFSGWQQQQDAPSVQREVAAALGRVLDHPVEITAAGRTDAGVHARGQVAHFDTAAQRTERALVLGANTLLPAGIAVRWARAVAGHFHARYSAGARTYRYCILNRASRSALAAGRVAFIHKPLDADAMRAAAAHLVGSHDFSALRAAECQAKSPVRDLSGLAVRRVGDFVLLEVTANAFLHHMVRNIAGLLVHIGHGEAQPGFAAEVLAGRDRRRAPATAPAAGLYLWRVHYAPVFGLPDDSDIMRCPSGCPADLMDSQ
ncbi:MAG TPA: tRNA pseudouridine(38-40) synthase TruA [Steroidobacteraceae bacterium]|nr:tRNA pseudouridine(38-40) synthase TruA [Steroidobacteraceae bacterium]